MSAVYGITGWKNSGKTGLMERLVKHFADRGVRVSTIKHAHHSFDIDHEGTDSARHRKAGAEEVAIVSDRRWALIKEIGSLGGKPTLAEMLDRLAPCDLVLVEGFKDSDIPKVETILRAHAKEPPVYLGNESVACVATDDPGLDCPHPVFQIDDTQAIADFIAQSSGLGL